MLCHKSLGAALFFSLLAPIGAEQLWLSNKPFPGVTQGTGLYLMVELEPFLEIMKIEAEDRGDTVVIGGFPLAVEVSSGRRMIHLQDAVDAAGLKLTRTPALDVVDVRAATAGLGDKGDWNASSTHRAENSSGSSTKIAGSGFSVSIPSRFKALVDQRYLESGESESAIPADLSAYSSLGAQTVAVVSSGTDIANGVLLLSIFPGMPEKITPANEGLVLEAMKAEFLSNGEEQIGPLSKVNVAGTPYHRLRVRLTENGQQHDTEYNIHFSNKHDMVMLVMIRAPKANFSRVAPQLRLVLNSLRMK